jgi:hypothetical protein
LFSQTVNVHIVDIRRGELLNRTVKELLDINLGLLSDEAFVQNIDYSGSVRWLDTKHLSDKVPQGFGVAGVNRGIGASQDLDCQTVDELGVKGMSQVAHFVHNTSESPNVGFVTVWL